MLPALFGKSKLRNKILKPFLIDINPNIITVVALLCAVIAGYLFYLTYFFLAGIFVLLNGFFDILDGEIAKKYDRTSKRGDFLDHTFDRIADTVILLGITLSPAVPDLLGYVTIITILLVSYLGTQAHALLKRRLYGGILGRADRLVLIVIASFLMVINLNVMLYAVLILFIFSIITFLERFSKIYYNLK